ncbi:succinyldiaminopimelate aminotransferase apoenzyme [Promicromonospora umidemergens]|uniref:Aminotransferase n=1 Tax=Promicromonospora umidemergens TaxID=629679 RepID=A0ABP8Y7U2_9MICO|nr:succinyldiaminopimelate transaminase [Promicromonospora umidemergens]MCP2284783.1 succinyldiaminopimelate aminotransferase apoenzyme [Promicromonospora umidemergens]
MGLHDLSDLSYPWDSIAGIAATARAHPGGLVDLSMGTPVDPTPEVVRHALEAASDAPGYPMTAGTPALRQAVADWFARRRGVPGLDPAAVVPTIGSKELVGLLPSLLHLGPGDVVVHPAVAYPTYVAGIRAAGATPLGCDDVADWAGRDDVRMVWVNSPGNPTGRVLDVEALRAVVEAARAIGAVVVSDECYAELAWEAPWVADPGAGPGHGGVPSVLDPRVCGGSHEGLLAAYSLSKQSSIAGYRAAFLAGDAAVIAELTQIRKHLGLIVPAPVQAAMTAALSDDEHVAAQRATYGARRRALAAALAAAGLTVDESGAGLYLWVAARDGRSGQQLAEWFAERGILTAPGHLYGDDKHTRVALTATDAQIADAVSRLTEA